MRCYYAAPHSLGCVASLRFLLRQATTQLADLLWTMGASQQLSEAEELYTRALELSSAASGPLSPESVALVNNLAVLLKVRRGGGVQGCAQRHRDAHPPAPSVTAS